MILLVSSLLQDLYFFLHLHISVDICISRPYRFVVEVAKGIKVSALSILVFLLGWDAGVFLHFLSV